MKKLYLFMFLLIAIVFSVAAQKKILYIGMQTIDKILPSDSFTVDFLSNPDYTITYIEDDAVEVTYNYSPYDAVVFGESCASSRVVAFGNTNKYPVPCMILEPLAVRDDKWGWVTNRELHWQENREGLLGWDKIQIKNNTHYITSVFDQDEVVQWSTATYDADNYQLYAHGFDLNTYIPSAIPLGQNMSSAITFPCLWALEPNTVVKASDTLKHRMIIWGTHAYAIANDDADDPNYRSIYATEGYKTLVARSLQWVLGSDVGIFDVTKNNFQVSAYPNPVNDQIRLEFSLDRPEMVSVRVVNIVGQTIKDTGKQYLPSGSNKIEINTRDLHGGLYMFILEAGSKTYTGKFNVVK
jgi:hypothetical protein